MLALKYHPDKNRDTVAESTTMFNNIKQAYEYLLLREEDDVLIEDLDNEYAGYGYGYGGSYYGDGATGTYDTLFNMFITSLFRQAAGNNRNGSGGINPNHMAAIMTIVRSIASDCKAMSLKLFEGLDKMTALQIYEIIQQYHDVLHISDENLAEFTGIMKRKMEDDDIVILKPTLDDVLHDKIYVLDFEGKKYYIPLWHNELYYKIDDKRDLIVKCIPELPANVTLDANNDMYIDVRVPLTKELLEQQWIDVSVGSSSKVYQIRVSDLLLRRNQMVQITCENGGGGGGGGGGPIATSPTTPATVGACIGIATINSKHIYDTTARARVFANVELGVWAD